MSSEIKHSRIQTNGIWMHVAEKGEGPLVLLIHGFPELWCCWSHQIDYLAANGYRAIAPDLRGYGETDRPEDPSSYTVFHVVGDLIGLLDQLSVAQAFVVGHDWGAEIAWHLSLFRPDRVKALFNLSVPFRPRSPQLKPSQIFKSTYGDGFYITQFLEPGRAEKSFAKYDPETVLKKFLLINAPDLLAAPPGVEFIDFLETPSALPSWIKEEELQYCATKFKETGFSGALNYYRAMDTNWELLGAWQGAKIEVPSKLMVADKDVGYISFGTKKYIKGEAFKKLVPNVEVVVIDGGHFMQQESALQVSKEILSFINSF